MPKARENEEDQVLIDSSFGSDRLKKWRKFPGPIKERNKATPDYNEFQISLA